VRHPSDRAPSLSVAGRRARTMPDASLMFRINDVS